MRFRPVSGLQSLFAGGSAPVAMAQRLRAWRRGFSGWSWHEYDLEHNDWRNYLPDSKSAKASAINGEAAKALLRNKLLFERILGEVLRVPKSFGLLESGVVTSLLPDFKVSTPADLLAWIKVNHGLILKPMDSSEGRGVLSLEYRGGELLMDKKATTVEAARLRLDAIKEAVVSEMVAQAEYSNAIFPDSVNTIRLLTMIDPSSGVPFVPTAMHRIGTRKSAPTDNLSRGGIHAGIDCKTGVMGPAKIYLSRSSDRSVRIDRHPETGVQIAGVEIPGWQAALDLLVETVRRYPILRYVGWDLVASENEIVVIEGNHSPTLSSQFYLPYLSDERVRNFFEHHGVVDGLPVPGTP